MFSLCILNLINEVNYEPRKEAKCFHLRLNH